MRPPARIASVVLAALLGLYHCSKSPTSSDERLPAPKLFVTPSDTTLSEKGIDAVESGDFIQLDWEQGDDQRPARYRIYRRMQTDEMFAELGAISGNQTSFIDSLGILVNKRYYYYIRAVSEDGEESSPSDTLNYLLLEKPFLLSQTNSSKPVFSWKVPSIQDSYILKLLEADTDKKIWVTQVESSYSDLESIAFDDRFKGPSPPQVDSLSLSTAYKWRVDIVGAAERSGSESNWKRFTLQ